MEYGKCIRYGVIFTCRSFPCSRFCIFYSAAPWQSYKPNILLLWKVKWNESEKKKREKKARAHTEHRHDEKCISYYYFYFIKWWFLCKYISKMLCLRRWRWNKNMKRDAGKIMFSMHIQRVSEWRLRAASHEHWAVCIWLCTYVEYECISIYLFCMWNAKGIDIERFSDATYFILCADRTHAHTFTSTFVQWVINELHMRYSFSRRMFFFSLVRNFIHSALFIFQLCVHSVQCVQSSLSLSLHFILWILDINTYFAYLFFICYGREYSYERTSI